jgi:hypothetical protein
MSISKKIPAIKPGKGPTMADYKLASKVSHGEKLKAMGSAELGPASHGGFARGGKTADGGSIPPEAKNQMLSAARAGRPQIVDPKGTGMTGRQIASMLERAGNGRKGG